MGNKPSSSSGTGGVPGPRAPAGPTLGTPQRPIGGGQPIPFEGGASAARSAASRVPSSAAPLPARESGAGADAGAGAVSAPRAAAARTAVLDDFVMLKTVGRGSFGKVIMVRKKDDSRIYAMKALKKEQVLKRKQYEHTVAERRILEVRRWPEDLR